MLSPVESPAGSPQPVKTQQHQQQYQQKHHQQQQLQQQQSSVSLVRARQSWGEFLQATGLTEPHQDNRNAQQQQQWTCNQQQQQQPGQQRHYKQHWLMSGVEPQNQASPEEHDSTQCGYMQQQQQQRPVRRQLLPLQQQQQHENSYNTAHTAQLLHHNSSLPSDAGLTAHMYQPNSSSNNSSNMMMFNTRPGYPSMYQPHMSASSGGPTAHMMGWITGSSSSSNGNKLRLAGTGGVFATFLTIIRRVLMMLCPNSLQWLLLVATSMLWGVKRLFGGSKAGGSSSSSGPALYHPSSSGSSSSIMGGVARYPPGTSSSGVQGVSPSPPAAMRRPSSPSGQMSGASSPRHSWL